MLRNRIIPCLLLHDKSLVKTKKFNQFNYIGDPCNTVRIFNELEVDELLVLDILASRNNLSPNISLLSEIANECFMPLAYGGGIKSIEDAKSIFDVGFEKISINTSAIEQPHLIKDLSEYFGSQAIIVSIDVSKGILGTQYIRTYGGQRKHPIDPIDFAKEAESLGAGEILLTSINQEGTWNGFDIELIKSVADSINIPVIANGGAGRTSDIKKAILEGNASAVSLGSMLVYQREGMGVLINYPRKIREMIKTI